MRRTKARATRYAAQNRVAAQKLYGLRLQAALTDPDEGARSECAKCRLPIQKLGGIWTEMLDGTTNCMAGSAVWTAHEPKQDDDESGQEG